MSSPTAKPFSLPVEQTLQKIALFSGISAEDLRKVAQAARRREAQSGSFLFFQEDPATNVYVLIEGRIRLAQVTPEGQQVILRYVVAGDEFGVVAALSGSRYPVSAEAMEDSAALSWDTQTIEKLMEHSPRIAINAMQILAKRVQEFQDRLREMATERVERRIARTILRLARQTGRETPEGVQIDFPITRQDLAEMAGTTLYTVSRMLSQWEAQGILISGREKIVLRFPHGLVAIAEDLPVPKTE